MQQFAEWLVIVQVIFFLLLLVPFYYWIRINAYKEVIPETEENSYSEKKISVILPMRNEVSNVERKLLSIIDEIRLHQNVELIVADSNSGDGTKEIAKDVLRSSPLERNRWNIMNFKDLGKNIALNGVLDTIDSEIIVISDADALVSPGWLKIICSRMEDREVGVVSGIEIESVSDARSFDLYYRQKSNILRLKESNIDSTPVLEGSILAWKSSALGSFRLDEKMNADDAQIGFISIRRGYRSIIDGRITFRRFGGLRRRTLRESVRRSQGLSMALIKNLDLVVASKRRRSIAAVFNAFFLYVIFPWVVVLFTINSVIAFSITPIFG